MFCFCGEDIRQTLGRISPAAGGGEAAAALIIMGSGCWALTGNGALTCRVSWSGNTHHHHPVDNIYSERSIFHRTLHLPALLLICICELSNPDNSKPPIIGHSDFKMNRKGFESCCAVTLLLTIFALFRLFGSTLTCHRRKS